MAYRFDKTTNSLVIDGFENGIAVSPYKGIANIRNMDTAYYPGVAYVNYARLPATTDGKWFAGVNSVNVSGNSGWIFTTSAQMTNPVQKAVSPAGLIYILDASGQIFKQTSVNGTSFNILGNGTGRVGTGANGLAYWNNYLVVFGNGFIEFCGDGTGDSEITESNWNIMTGSATSSAVFTTNYTSHDDRFLFLTDEFPIFQINDPVQFATTGTLPAGISALTTYYILDVKPTYITVSATLGGSAVTISSNGSGTLTVTDYAIPVPLGNCTNLVVSGASPGSVTLTIVSYTDPTGGSVGANWQGATGLYNIVMTDGQKLAANFTHGSATVNLLSEIVYVTGNDWGIELINPTVSFYRPYVSKVDGSLLFCNGQFIGRIAESSNTNAVFNPGLAETYTVSFGVASIPEQFTDQVTDMVDLKSQLVVAGIRDIYVWDYVSPQTSSPSPIGENISSLTNLLNNIYVLAGEKGNIYLSNGYSAQLMYKLPDFIAGVFDPVWKWGGEMTHRSRLFFQALAQDTSGNNILAGIFSLMVSPTVTGESATGLVMESQNSYGLTPALGATGAGLLIDNSPSANGNDSYYSAWSNGSNVGGIDYNTTQLWGNYEPTIETDLMDLGQVMTPATFGNLEFKLDRPMQSGDKIKVSWRDSLTASYIPIGETTDGVLSAYYTSNIAQTQWIQFKIQMSCAASNSSFVPLRQIRLYMQNK